MAALPTMLNSGDGNHPHFGGVKTRHSGTAQALTGTVTVEDEALSGVTVKITGMAESETLTGTTGQYSFTGLRAGNYTVEISGFDDEDVGFGATTSTADLDVGESKVVTFEGTYLRASSIMGQVSIEGRGLADVTVSLQGKGETREVPTNGAGQFLFEDLRRGDYAIGISGYDDDEYGFEVTSKSVHVPYGETENVPFEGIALRTAEIRGVVAIDGMGPLEGVTVSLTGKGDDPDPVVTMGDGRFSFDRLHAGDYTLSIFGYDTDEYGFDVTSRNVTVALKETATLEFDGIMLRTAAIEGVVTVKGDGLKDVTVTVAGGPKDETHVKTTNGAGMYHVGDLHAGDYSVTISGYDTREYGFKVTTRSVSVGLRETFEVEAFDGILLRTAGVSGRVTVGDEPMSGWTVTLSGEEDRPGEKTNANGQYGFSGLAAGKYTLTLSGYDTDEYEFDAEMEIELELDEAAIANFEGRMLRTVAVMGTVSAEGDGIANVGVTLIKVLGATTGEVLDAMMTDEDGGYMFGELLTGTYRIELGETDEEYDFATKSRMGSVATDDTATWNFDAEIIRTASVGGMVTVDGDGMGDVMVMLTGDHGTDEEMETRSDGSYMFEGLRKGSYTVSMENPNDDAYDFPNTSRRVSLAVGQTQTDISFAGSMLRRASISGQVHVEGDGLEGVTVTLDGDMEDETVTDGNGEYNFPGLAGGDYEVSIENPDEDAYSFDTTEVDVEDLGDDEAEIVDFAGEHTATASISGVMFADEVTVDSLYTEGEPLLPFDSFPLILQGPGVNDARLAATDSTGAYSFDGLKAGQYNVVIDLPDALEAALSKAGYAFSGNTLHLGIDVPAATDVDVDLPLRITKQTIYVGAFLANAKSIGAPLGGVTMKLYPTAADAAEGTNSLGSARTKIGKLDDAETGFAEFEFDREDDTGPGGSAIDYLVYARVTGAPRDLAVHSNSVIEIGYNQADRVTLEQTAAKFVNTRVNFQWWVKSDEDAKDGDQFLEGWKATNGKATNSRGLATYSDTVTTAQRDLLAAGTPVKFSVELDTAQLADVDGNEKWRQSSALSHTHTGLEHPDSNRASHNDLGAIEVTWTTQALVLGVYREADDYDGFTNYQSKLPGGDHRPAAAVARGMSLTVWELDDRRLVPYKYDHDACTNKNSSKTDEREASLTITDGLARIACLPANDEFTIEFDVGDDRVEVGAAQRLGGYLDVYDRRDLSVGGTVIGTFGAGSGGVPEVRVCLSSEGTSDDECATWGYQWENGTISGNVGTASGHRLKVEATTENHGARDTTGTSGAEGAYSIGGLRDGEYDITASSTSKYKVLGDATQAVYVYYDETAGTAGAATAIWETEGPDATLKSLALDEADLNEEFDPDSTDYTAEVAPSVDEVEVTWKTSDSDATTDPKSPHTLELDDQGETEKLTITVRDGSTTNKYTLTVLRAAETDDATLKSLGLADEDLELNEPFDPGTTDYTADVPSGTGRVTVEWETNDKYARTRPGSTGGGSHSLSLDDPGETTRLRIIVISSDGEEETDYVLTVSRAAPSDDATLKSLGLADAGLELNEDFDPETTEYTATVRYDVEDVEVEWETTDGDATTDPASSPHTLDLDAAGQTTDIEIVVTPANGDEDLEKTYTIEVTRMVASDDATLSALGLADEDLALNETFDPAVTEYTADVGYGVSELDVEWETSDEGAETDPAASPHTFELDDPGETAALTITVTAEDGSEEEYTITVTRAVAGTDATLGSLALTNADGDEVTLTPAFSASTLDYEATAKFDDEEVEVTWATADENAATDPAQPAEGSSHTLALDDQGETVKLTITVTAEDGETEEEYTVTVLRPVAGDDATLSSLGLADDDLSLNETFASGTYEYTATVRYNVGELEVEWETNDPDATTDPASSPNTFDLNDAGGDPTDLEIVVTPANGDEDLAQTYTITVTRNVASDDATLSALTLEDGAGNDLTMNGTFSSDVTEYTADVPYKHTEVEVGWTTTDAGAETDPAQPAEGSTHTLELDDPGETATLTITVTAEDDTEKEYTLTVTRGTASTDADLGSLALTDADGNAVSLNETFSGSRTAYTANADHDDEEVRVTWTTSDENATTVPAQPAEGSQYTLELDDVGETVTLTITVTAEDESTKEYTLTVLREPMSTDNSLSSLSITGVSLSPAFNSAVYAYTATATFDDEEVEFAFAANDDEATTDPATSPHTLALSPGENEQTITVTAEDGTAQAYTITVSRPGFLLKQLDGTVISEGITVTEGEEPDTFTVELATEPEDPAYSIVVELDYGTLTGGVPASAVTFNAGGTYEWDDTVRVYFSVPDDADAEPNEATEITLTVTDASTGNDDYPEDSETEVPVTTTENDTKGVVVTPAAREVSEGATTTYSMVLTSLPVGGSVIVEISGEPEDDVTVPAQMIFTVGRWQLVDGPDRRGQHGTWRG